jgi:hypothetical protein
MALILLFVVVVLLLLGIAAAPFAGFGAMIVLFGIALAVGLVALALVAGVSADRLPRAPRDQFLGPGGQDDPDRSARRPRTSDSR